MLNAENTDTYTNSNSTDADIASCAVCSCIIAMYKLCKCSAVDRKPDYRARILLLLLYRNARKFARKYEESNIAIMKRRVTVLQRTTVLQASGGKGINSIHYHGQASGRKLCNLLAAAQERTAECSQRYLKKIQ